MSELHPYVVSLFVGATPEIKLPTDYRRRDEIFPVVEERVAALAATYDISDLFDPSDVANIIFDLMLEHSALQIDEPRFAGKYYIFSEKHYRNMRGNFQNSDGITATANRIGSRFYPDVFEGFRAENGVQAVTTFQIPASDRIVRLDDNLPQAEEIREKTAELIVALEKGNDVGDLTANEVEVAANEVRDLQGMMSRSSVRSAVIAQYSLRVLRWIGEKAAGAAVGKIAWGLLILLAALFGFGS